mgnify:CR=1 FL=1
MGKSTKKKQQQAKGKRAASSDNDGNRGAGRPRRTPRRSADAMDGLPVATKGANFKATSDDTYCTVTRSPLFLDPQRNQNGML